MKRKASSSNKRSAKRRRTVKSLKNAVRRVLLRTAETKYAVGHQENLQLYHNTGVAGTHVFIGNCLSTSQGQGEENRIGDKVQAVGLSLKLMLFNKSDRPNVTYRIIVFTAPPDQSASGNPVGFWEADIGNKIMDNINTNKYKVIKEKFIQVQGQDTAFEAGVDTLREKSKSLQMYIPLKGRQVVYSSENGAVPKYQRDVIQVAIIAYDAYGTLTTDNIASFAWMRKFYFKDI